MQSMMKVNAATLESFYSMYDKYSLSQEELKEIKIRRSQKLQDVF